MAIIGINVHHMFPEKGMEIEAFDLTDKKPIGDLDPIFKLKKGSDDVDYILIAGMIVPLEGDLATKQYYTVEKYLNYLLGQIDNADPTANEQLQVVKDIINTITTKYPNVVINVIERFGRLTIEELRK